MSVDSFHICADQRQVAAWWQQPMRVLAEELAQWRLGERPTHVFLLDDEDAGEVLLEPLRALQEQCGAERSLSAACSMALTALRAQPPETPSLAARALRFVRTPPPSAADQQFAALADLADFYRTLHEAARTGPVTEPVDVRAADVFLSTYLVPLLGADEAARYNASIPDNTLGSYGPPEFAQLGSASAERIAADMAAPCYQLDARAWQRMWDRLDSIPQFWDELAQHTNARVLAHLRGIGAVARYAAAHNLVMLTITM